MQRLDTSPPPPPPQSVSDWMSAGDVNKNTPYGWDGFSSSWGK